MSRFQNMTLVFDVGVGKQVEELARQLRINVISIRDMDPRMADVDILKLAVAENAVVVTMDKDFGELVYHSGWPHHGVLLLRLDDANGMEKVGVFKSILDNYSERLFGSFSVYKDGNLRIR